jgi:hypothetical protein
MNDKYIFVIPILIVLRIAYAQILIWPVIINQALLRLNQENNLGVNPWCKDA